MQVSLKPETQRLIEEKLNAPMAESLDDATLDAIDRSEDQIERGEVHDWKDVREQVRAKFLGE